MLFSRMNICASGDRGSLMVRKSCLLLLSMKVEGRSRRSSSGRLGVGEL